MSELEPLDPSLVSLIERERGSYAFDPEKRSEMFRHLQRSLLLAGTVGSAAKIGSLAQGAARVGGAKVVVLSSWKAGLLAVAFVGVGAGLGTGVAEVRHARMDQTRTAAPIRSAVAKPPPANVEERTNAVDVVEVARDLDTAATRSVGAPAANTSEKLFVPSAKSRSLGERPSASTEANSQPHATSELEGERVLIDTARMALSRGRARDAIETLKRHTQEFPKGRLAEEREALAVQAWAASGDRAEATKRAARFHRFYPQSIFGPSVDKALAGN